MRSQLWGSTPCPVPSSVRRLSQTYGGNSVLSGLLDSRNVLVKVASPLLLKVFFAHQQHQPSPGAFQKCRVLGPAPDLLCQNPCLTRSPRDCTAQESSRSASPNPALESPPSHPDEQASILFLASSIFFQVPLFHPNTSPTFRISSLS